MNRKSELRGIVLDIIFGREKVFFDPFDFGHLTAGVAEILYRRDGHPQYSAGDPTSSERRLDDEDWLLVQEIFWDLICERVINPGSDPANKDLPWFRLHSEAAENLKSV